MVRTPDLPGPLRLDAGTGPWCDARLTSEIRHRATVLLERWEPAAWDERVLPRLLHRMREETEPEAREAAYRALSTLLAVRAGLPGGRRLDAPPTPL
ncbi:hypothetical protein JRI60_17550 [Archangium violaceum]|uniref:hypothetical protein n=1 Tax=Archangium violaceum TaxID=83451 RepID=UPI00194E1BCB|nr:hypothetical protein [Archangium violaceum]QRO00703.1 hypothetical protein JRI60_17550 [Archangium violaceum]